MYLKTWEVHVQIRSSGGFDQVVGLELYQVYQSHLCESYHEGKVIQT